VVRIGILREFVVVTGSRIEWCQELDISVVPGNVSYICVNCFIGYAQQVPHISGHHLSFRTSAPAYSDPT